MSKRNVLVVMLLLAALVVTALPNLGSAPIQAQDGEGVLIDLDHPYAPFLESRAYAASLGATAEFRKMEYVAIDPVNMKLYLAMSEVGRGMSDGEGDVNVDENLCGIVYEGDLDENMNTTELRPLIIGGPYDPEGGANRCDVNNIANPDNLEVDARGRVWIYEDTGFHENNMAWVYDPADGSLKRFAYTQLGAEVTGARIAPNGSLFLNIQHPDAMNIYPYNASTVGVVTNFNANEDDFESIAVPEGDDKRIAGVAAGEYQILGRVGDPIPGDPHGLAFGQVVRPDGTTQLFCNQADGNMYLPTNSAGTEGILYTNFECRPGTLSRLNIALQADGTWLVQDGEVVDFASVNGTWNNCGASNTPWNTGLTAEEYEPYAGDLTSVADLTDYLGRQANPYDYGWIVELEPFAVGNRITKRYAMGRRSHENSWVAPDEQTVYFGDDGSDVVLFKFVAEEPGDLSAGTLYAARVTQTGGTGDDHAFQLEWIELGFGFDDEIEAAVREIDAQLQ
ncbi:MAG: DUF839 domain-containing protein [Chloroflexi bacterium]|nr:DUF839 domain-containing protein [Chloroflexota bacterium]